MLAVEPSGSIFSAAFDYSNKGREISCSFGYQTSFDSSGYSCGEDLTKMPVDLSAYLMSSSPPGFGLYNALGMNGFDAYTNAVAPLKPILSKTTPDVEDRDLDRTLKSSSPICVCFACQSQNQVIGSDFLSDTHLFLNSPLAGSDDEDSDDSSFDDIVEDCRRLSLEDSAESSENEIQQSSATKVCSFTRRVTFADCKGLPLTEVRIMTETSDSPPNIHPHLLSSLTDGALPGVTERPPLKLNFPQPASDYYVFREKLKHQSVCLENVILKDYAVLGTVKVKNYSFEKTVQIRVTFDGWMSHKDVTASFVHRGDDTGALEYDTFSFELRVPTTLRHDQSVEFCVHYQCAAGDFWDSNNGTNYCIHSVDYNVPAPSLYTRDFRPNFSAVEVWSEYSSWQFSAEESRYY